MNPDQQTQNDDPNQRFQPTDPQQPQVFTPSGGPQRVGSPPAPTDPSPPFPPQQPLQPVGSPPAGPVPPARPKKRLMVMLTVAVVGLALLVGGSAAAYYLVVVPNKPENVLKSALQNTAKQSQVNFDGKVTSTSSGLAAAVTARGGVDTQAKAMQMTADITISGVKVSVELRFVDNAIYLKFGDLSAIKNISEIASSEYTEVVDKATKPLSNQWIEVDETLLAQAGADCYLDVSWGASQEDLQKLVDHYEMKPFANIKGTDDEAVDGHSATKYDIVIDDNKLSEYFKDIPSVSALEQLKQCGSKKDPFNERYLKELADNDTTPLQIWVDKETKLISKVASQSTPQDKEKDDFTGNAEIKLTYGAVKVEKPEGAKPAVQVYNELRKALGMGSSSSLDLTPSGGGADFLNSVQL